MNTAVGPVTRGNGPEALADVPDVDLADEAFRADTADAFDRLRAVSWIVRTVRGYEVLDYEVVRQMCVDRRLDSIGAEYYQNLGASEPVMWWATQGSLPMIEGERHDRIRASLQRGFTRRRIDALRPLMRTIAGRLVDSLAEHDPLDLVAEFTHRYPLEVMCGLMGVPGEDVDRFLAWTVDLGLLARVPLAPHLGRLDEAIEGLRAYLHELAARRRVEPCDDFVTDLVGAQNDGALTEDELEGALLNLLFAAHDTTRYQFGWVVQQLVRHGAWTAVRADRALVPNAVDEAMRVEPALHIMLRKAATDVEYRGLVIPRGTLLTLNIYAANHDPAVFPDPHRFDLSRPNAGRHVGFGHGGHLCLGHALARAEMAEALDIFLDRFAELWVAEDPWHESGFSSMSGAERILLSAQPPATQGLRRGVDGGRDTAYIPDTF